MLLQTQNYEAIKQELKDLLNLSRDAGGAGGATSLIEDAFIPRYTAIANAYSKGIIYPIRDDDGDIANNINTAFEDLSRKIISRMGLQLG